MTLKSEFFDLVESETLVNIGMEDVKIIGDFLDRYEAAVRASKEEEKRKEGSL